MASETESDTQQQTKVSTRVRYDSMETQFASQFIVNSTREEIIVNFSPGPLVDPQSREQLLPINTRIAMTPQGAARLTRTLTDVLKSLGAAARAEKHQDDKPAGDLN